jgi:predicted RNase H-like HicB family nuclease
MKARTSIVIEKDAHGYYAYCPTLPGCQSEGSTFDEALTNIKEAIELYCETLSPEEAEEYLTKELYTTSVEVSFG